MRKLSFATLLAVLLASALASAQQGHRYQPPPVVVAVTGGSCTNQVVTANDTQAVPTCATVVSTMTDTSIAKTGTDVNTSNQVTATHLASALPVAQGGTGLATLTAHALYVGNGASAPNSVAVCGTGTYVRGVAASDPVCSTLTLPNTSVTGDLMVATGTNVEGAVTAVAAGSYLRANGVGAAPIYSTLTLPNTAPAGSIFIASATNVVSAATPGSVNANPANQTGNATATLKMNGLGAAAAPCLLTPATSGRVGFSISGRAVQNTTADGISLKMTYGTGTPPANAAVASGTALTPTVTHTALTGALEEYFSFTGVATGLSLVATWFDLQVAEVTGGTASVVDVTCAAWEF